MSKSSIYKITSFQYVDDKISEVKENRTFFYTLAKDMVEHGANEEIVPSYSDDRTTVYTDKNGRIRYLIQEFIVEITDNTVDFSKSHTDDLHWGHSKGNVDVNVYIEHLKEESV